ncbi:reverse transcriptase domain-containing protein [Tanacetum coccineum]
MGGPKDEEAMPMEVTEEEDIAGISDGTEFQNLAVNGLTRDENDKIPTSETFLRSPTPEKESTTDLVILQMEEDGKVPLILGRPFLHTADAIIRVKNKELNLGVEDDRITVLIDKVM